MTRLKGKVKFFDTEKGYGYICDLENLESEYKVNASDIIGFDFPKRGDIVSFNGSENPKTKKKVAVEVRIEEVDDTKPKYFLPNANLPNTNIKMELRPGDPRTECPHCGAISVHRTIGYGISGPFKKCVKCGYLLSGRTEIRIFFGLLFGFLILVGLKVIG